MDSQSQVSVWAAHPHGPYLNLKVSLMVLWKGYPKGHQWVLERFASLVCTGVQLSGAQFRQPGFDA
jgi:hypothetical protein